jgi:hypothetical protein
MSINLKELASEVHQISLDHGWWDKYDYWHDYYSSRCISDSNNPCPDILVAKLALIHSEISEAYNEWTGEKTKLYYNPDRPDKPEGMIVELADALFRTLDVREHLGHRIRTPLEELVDYGKVSDPFCQMHCMVSNAVERLRRNDTHGMETHLGVLMELNCFYAYHFFGKSWEPFEKAIRVKMAYNKTREIRHGGKAL